MKKYLKITLIILAIILLKLLYSFSINEIIIKNYNNGTYNKVLIKTLYFLNLNEPYIAYYNEGNIQYKLENYDKAIEKYNKALNKRPSRKRVCDIRINLSLAMIKNINQNDDYQTVFNQLEEAKNNLYNDNCASPTDYSGQSQDAEYLEEEIKKLQEELNSDPSDPNNDPNDDPNNEPNNDDDYKEIEERLKEIEKEAQKNREEDLKDDKYLNDYSYYDGKKW